MSSLLDRILSDPLTTAWDCAKNRCSLDEASSLLRDLIMKPYGSREYLIALAFLARFKVEASPDKIVYLARKLFTGDIVEKILKDTSEENVLKTYKENYWLSMNMLMLWEYLVLAGEVKQVTIRSINLVDKTLSMIEKNYNEVKDLVQALLYGPVNTLPYSIARVILENYLKLPTRNDVVLFKIDILNMITSSYPPKIYLEQEDFVETIGATIADLANHIIELINDDPDKGIQLANELKLIYEKIRNHCYELDDYKPCSIIDGKALQSIDRLYGKISTIYRMIIQAQE
ncbi:MAG: hypothetical protein J7K21_07605 [Desulfurococcales archaeon]|nr:hypothetical protein [Desulfurococcales archaeon]